MAKLISYETAQDRILSSTKALSEVLLPADETLGLVLARDLPADRDLPPFDRAAMDGYALRADDTSPAPARLKIVGEALPGSEPVLEIGPGEAARIMTGAPLPYGADAVQIIEICSEHGDHVEIGEPVEAGRNISPRGEDARTGDILLRRGTVVTPAVTAALASIGAVEVSVIRRPRVSLVSTGDEVIPPQATPSPTQIRDANGPALAARLRMAGALISETGITRDSRGALQEAIEKIDELDALVITGGVSMGRYDLVKEVLEQAGAQFIFSGVAIRPGKPTTFALLRGRPVFALPGNPVSCLVAAELFVVPALRAMMGYPQPLPPLIRAELLGALATDPLRTYFHPARLLWRDGVPAAEPLVLHGSGDFAHFALAQVLVLVPPERNLERHEIIDILPLNDSLSGSKPKRNP
jgi:molybdopterin molybdotransferase